MFTVYLQQGHYHTVDAKWLDTTLQDWECAARNYWKGLTTEKPIYEVIVQGALYLPGWEKIRTCPTDIIKTING